MLLACTQKACSGHNQQPERTHEQIVRSGWVTAALVWNSKELFSYISLPKLDFLKLAGSALEVRCKHTFPAAL